MNPIGEKAPGPQVIGYYIFSPLRSRMSHNKAIPDLNGFP